MFFTPELGKSLLGLRITCFLGRARACVRREERRCEKTEAAIKQGIAAPDWPRYGTRPPLRYLCVLPAVRAAGGGFRRRRGALCACRCTLGRLFGLTYAARPRAWRYALAAAIGCLIASSVLSRRLSSHRTHAPSQHRLQANLFLKSGFREDPAPGARHFERVLTCTFFTGLPCQSFLQAGLFKRSA